MAQSIVIKEGFLSNPSTLIELYELDGTSIGLSTVYRFYDGTTNNFLPIVFNTVQYTPFPLKVDGMEFDGKGSLPRPKVTIANINGFVSSLLLQNQQLIGAKFTRIRVNARFLDNSNFYGGANPYGTPDPTAKLEDDIFYINRKITETPEIVQFELSTILELEDVKLPNRPIYAVICPFRFRDPETCGYTGDPIADRNNKLFVGGAGTYGFSSLVDKGQYSSATTYAAGDYVYIVSTLPQTSGNKLYYVCNQNGTVGAANSPTAKPSLWLADQCAYNLAGCKLHFSNGALPFGGYPGISRAEFVDSF